MNNPIQKSEKKTYQITFFTKHPKKVEKILFENNLVQQHYIVSEIVTWVPMTGVEND